MQVVTLDENKFNASCDLLADEMVKHCRPVVIVGVRTGGAVVAERVCSRFRKKKINMVYHEVSASRNSSNIKRESNISRLFYYLPIFVLNFLRLLEHYFLKIMLLFNRNQQRNICLNESVRLCLAQLKEGCIFVVDDAIDSGATVKYLIDEFKKINSALDFKTAVIVQTQPSSMIAPDVCLYKNVLIRFPWSNDFKR